MEILKYVSILQAQVEDVWKYHRHPLSIVRGIPPQENCQVTFLEKTLNNDKIAFTFLKRFFIRKWVFERLFRDHSILGKQLQGPFVSFEHHIKIEQKGASVTEVIDEVHYQLPPIVGWLFQGYIKKTLLKLFNYRHLVLKKDLEKLALYRDKKPLKIALSGSTGFVGSHIKTVLQLFGHEVYALVRKRPQHSHEIFWDPEKKKITASDLEGLDVCIHLGGASIAAPFWTAKKKASIYKSRIESTRFLVETLNTLTKPPHVFLSASAMGFYGNRPEEKVDEHASRGHGFLAHVTKDWEKEAHHFKGRVVCLRFGLILGWGGLLKKVLPLYKWGLGACIGTGKEKISWIAVDDVAYHLLQAIYDKSLSHEVNFVSPYSVTSREFSTLLAKHLHRPLFFKLPAWLIKIIFQEMGKELLLADVDVHPQKLLNVGAVFAYLHLDDVFSLMF